MRRREDLIYVGIDLHKETHTAVILSCWNEKLGEITIANKPSEFYKLTTKVKKYLTDGVIPVYGLENAYGYGRALAVWLIGKGYFVKDVNPALSFAQRKSTPIYKKDDSHDAEAVALVLINKLDKLPDAVPDDAHWTLSQVMRRRDTIKTHQVRLKNQLHEQLCTVYPSYKQFFSDINCQTALYFFQEYPSPEYRNGKTVEGLAEELRVPSHNSCSTKKCEKLLKFIAFDGVPRREYQSARDTITRSIIRDLQHYNEQLKEVEQALKEMYPTFECTLMTIPGIDLVTACKLLSEIGDIKRFSNAV